MNQTGKKSLLIRADANISIGTGHVMRCLALAQAWQDSGGEVTFLMAPGSPSLEQRIFLEGMNVLTIKEQPGSNDDATITAEIAKKIESSWVVVDGYQFGAEYQKILKENNCRIIFIDDYGHADHYYADLVLNQNIYADMSFYKKYEPYTRFLLGTNFVLLRREFLNYVGYNRKIPAIAHRVLVTFGGGDLDNTTLKIIEALKKIEIDGLEVIAVVGGVSQTYETLKQSVINYSGFSVRKNVTNMPELMIWADIAISAGGSTCWELVFLGLPTILYSVSENQKSNVSIFHSKGIAKWFDDKNIGNSEINAITITQFLMSHQDRSFLHQKMKKIIDGNGSLRVMMNIDKNNFHLRLAKKDDCKILWEWVNDPVVRKSAFNQENILWNEHKKWFAEKISNPHCFIYILTTKQGKNIGQIRFDIINESADVDVSIDRNMRGCGMGSKIIVEGVKMFVEMTKISHINAYIKKDNIASIRSFEKAGFAVADTPNDSGLDAIHMIWQEIY